MLLVVFMYAVLAATFTVAKKALQYSSPYFLIGFRMTLAGSLFLLFQYFFNHKKFFIKKEDIFLLIKTAFFYIYLAFIPEFWALQRLTSSKVVIIYSITPFIAAVLAHFLASERLSVRKIIGIIVGFTGIIPILITHDQNGQFTSELFKISMAEAVLLVAVFSAAYGWFPVKRLLKKGYSLPMVNGVTMSLGGVAALVTSFFAEGFFVTHVSDVGGFLFWTLLLILLANVIFYNLYGWLLGHYSFTLLSLAGFLCPIFGSLYGWYFLSEPITLYHVLSLCLIIIGLFLFYREESRRK